MIFRRTIFLVFFFVSLSSAQNTTQDTIRGTYSYTYGDKESLVDARQTCKNLAIREAIESYTTFVKSSTNVKDFQLKDDIIRSIAGGYLHDVRVVDEKEEGRTITITVEATVDSSEVRQLIDKMIQSGETVTEVPEDSSQKEVSSKGQIYGFSTLLSEYENETRTAETAWQQGRFGNALDHMQKLQSFLEQRKPDRKNRFRWLVYSLMRKRTIIIINFLKIEQLESQGKKRPARIMLRALARKAAELRKEMAELETLPDLTGAQKIVRKKCLSQCRSTLKRIKRRIVARRRRRQ